jgi:signal transduction histidine kinase/HAMP domain-containing protein
MKLASKLSITITTFTLLATGASGVAGYMAGQGGVQPVLLMGASLVIAAVSIIAMVVILNSQITKPIRSLNSAIDRISLGDLSQAVPVRTHDELGALSQNFNEMTRQLSTTYRSLEASTQIAKEGHAQLESSINSLRQSFILVDINNHVTLANTATMEMIHSDKKQGKDRKQLQLEDVDRALPAGFKLADKITKALKSRSLFTFSGLSLGDRFVNLYLSPVLDEAKAIGCVLLLEDITEAKILERSKDEFFSIASHELRTPLTAIKGNASLMLEYYPEAFKDRELREMAEDVHTSSIRLIEIVNDFLDLSRLEQGKISFKLQPVALDKVIEQVSYEIGPVLKQKQLNIKVDDSIKQLGALPPVYGDPDRIKQVVYNLVGNAAKFTDEGGIIITAHLDSKFVKVLVTDTGRGISAEGRKLLFHKFQQAGSSLLTRDTTRGTGLGLYISRLLVSGMHGQIGLESSAPGEGTTFFFALPIATGAQAEMPVEATADGDLAKTHPAKTHKPLASPRILIFEDDPYVQRMYRRVFSFKDWQIELATNGEHGVTRAEVFKPSLILLDLMMPKVDGMALLKQLKSQPQTKDIPVLVLTNVGETSTISEAKQLGAIGYLIKADFTPEQLLIEIKKHL